MRPLDIEELAEGIKLCIENAKSLLNEAELLYSNGKLPRAFSLAVLSVEEMGKIPMLVRAACFEKDEKTRWSEFWKRWRNHEFKYGRSLGPGILGLTPTLNEKLLDFIKKYEMLKLRGLYVDYNKEIGKFQSPLTIFTKDKVEEIIKMAKIHLREIEGLYGNVENVKSLLQEIKNTPRPEAPTNSKSGSLG
jgi:AbiV family abortive infection protein